MAAVTLTPPPPGVYTWRVPYRLDGVRGAIQMSWNVPLQSWQLRIYDQNGNQVAGPIGVNNSSDDLWGQWHSYEIPPGALTCTSTAHIPGATAFEAGARLVYEPVG